MLSLTCEQLCTYSRVLDSQEYVSDLQSHPYKFSSLFLSRIANTFVNAHCVCCFLLIKTYPPEARKGTLKTKEENQIQKAAEAPKMYKVQGSLLLVYSSSEGWVKMGKMLMYSSL